MTDREVVSSGWVADTLDEMDTIVTASSDPPPESGTSASPKAPPKAPPKGPTRPTRPSSLAPTFGSADAPPPPYVETEPAPPAFDAKRPGFVFFGARPQPFDLDQYPVSASSAATRRRRKRGALWDRTHRTWMWLGSFGVFSCFVAATGLTVAALKLLDDKDVGFSL
jgi:hypothetical protein